jgi:thiamine transport system substrate-binding protein
MSTPRIASRGSIATATAPGRRASASPTAPRRLALALAGAAVLLAGGFPAAAQGETLTLMTHDSFYLPDAIVQAFEAEHGVHLEVLASGDAGAMVNQAILTADRPLADVLYGIDNTFLSRALDAGIFQAYDSAALADVPSDLVLDPQHRVTPIDTADVCLNIDRQAFQEGGLPVPQKLEDLLDPALKGKLVVENPATSSPGLAFLLATIATFGEDPDTGWQAFWKGLRANDVQISAGWEDAYHGAFSGGSGEGDRPIVVSYASSPAAEVVFGPDPKADQSPTASLPAGCFRQVEFAGVLKGTDQPELAGALIDFLLAPQTQAELPMAMYVYPARSDVALPDVFARFATRPADPLSLDPQAIAAGRDEWIRQWTDIMLR